MFRDCTSNLKTVILQESIYLESTISIIYQLCKQLVFGLFMPFIGDGSSVEGGEQGGEELYEGNAP